MDNIRYINVTTGETLETRNLNVDTILEVTNIALEWVELGYTVKLQAINQEARTTKI